MVACQGRSFPCAGSELPWLDVLLGAGFIISLPPSFSEAIMLVLWFGAFFSFERLYFLTVACSSSRRMQVREALFMSCPRCLSTRVKGFAQPGHIAQFPAASRFLALSS